MTDETTGHGGPAANHPSHGWRHTLLPMPPGMELAPEFLEAMRHPSYPLSAAYDPRWIFANAMGPIPTWLLENLIPYMQFEAGQRVLDLGCGGAASSIMLACEFGVEVAAADLWIDPDDNAARIAEAGVVELVTPIRAEARKLPFEHASFDAIISIDAYHYFGTDIRYLSYLAQFLKPGGRIGIVVPGNSVDPDDPDATRPPEKIAESFGADWFTFRSPQWWRRHWSYTLPVDVELAEWVEGGRESWLRYNDAAKAWSAKAAAHIIDDELLACEAGQTLGFCKLVAKRNEKHSLHFGPGDYATRIA